MAENMGVITVTGRKKLCMALAGDAELPVITRMAWGDGGVDSDGQPLGATGNEIGLYNELLVKDVESHEYINDEQTTCRYSCILEAGELSGKKISEMGLYDADGDLIAYRNFFQKGKDADIPQIYKMDTIF